MVDRVSKGRLRRGRVGRAPPNGVGLWATFTTVAVLLGALLAPQIGWAAGSGSFSPTGSMGTQRFAPVAASLPDGRVLVAGGYNGSYLPSAEAFNASTNSFSSAGIGAMGTGRRGALAAPLPHGRVLVAGG